MKSKKQTGGRGGRSPSLGVSPGERGGKGGNYILDRLLVPRLENYALNNSLEDVDEVTEALRQLHREYQRRQFGAFRQMVAKAIRVVESKGDAGDAKPEIKLQAMEQKHIAKQKGSEGDGGEGGISSGSDSEGEGSSSGSEGGSDNSSDDSSSEPELDAEQASELAAASKGGMNNSLLNMYARKAEEEDSAEPGPGSSTAGGASSRKRPRTPAFAPPEAVAAAAKRALAAERAVKMGLPLSSSAATPQAGTAAAAGGEAAGTSNPATPAPALAPASQPEQGEDAPQVAPPPQTPAEGGAGVDAQGGAAVTPFAGAGKTSAAAGGTDKAATGAGRSGRAGQGKEGGQAAGDKSALKRARRASSGVPGGGFAGGGGGGGFAGGGRRGSSVVVSPRPVRYADLGGVEDVLADIRELIEYPLKHPEVYAWLGVEPPRGVLLHGPPGCGKTALANAIANECGVPFLRVSAPEIVSGMSGESEAKLRGLFQEAAELAPCIVFLDEIDAIAPKRETAQREMERRIVAQMLTCMDDLGAGGGADDQGEASGTQGADGAPGSKPPGEGQGQGDGEEKAPVGRAHVIVIGATNRPDSLDPALRRAGRFDREITLGIPSEAARAQILKVITRRLRLEGNFDFARVAKRTPGFVGADLMALVKEAAALAVTRIFTALAPGAADQAALPAAELVVGALALPSSAPAPDAEAAPAQDGTQQQQVAVVAAPQAGGLLCPTERFGQGPLGVSELRGLAITSADFDTAVGKVQPSVRREGFTTTPDVTWEDVGSLDEVREELSFSITQPIMHPERFEALGLAAATGVLLYGPPGCGKTLVAKAVAQESGANFISIKGPELLNKYVGESERAVRQLFARARAAHPCVLFFDELDALAPRRGTDNNQAAERVVNQLLTEMDGIDGRQGVFMVAATNRPDMIDPALLRPGRLDKVLYVPLPPPDGRASILRALTRKTPMAPDVDVQALGMSPLCNGFSGADMAALVREAAVLALKESMARDAQRDAERAADGMAAVPGDKVLVRACHFEAAVRRVVPSVSKRDQRCYDALRGRLRSTRGRIEAGDTAPTAVIGPSVDGDGDVDMAATAPADAPASRPRGSLTGDGGDADMGEPQLA